MPAPAQAPSVHCCNVPSFGGSLWESQPESCKLSLQLCLAHLIADSSHEALKKAHGIATLLVLR